VDTSPAVTTPAALPAPQEIRRTARSTIALLVGVYIIDYVDRVMIAVALPLIGAEFGLVKTEQGLVVSAFALAYMLSQLPGGLLADRVGARPLLVISLVGWSVFAAATGLAPGFVVLLVIRALFGIAQALFPAASLKALAERTTPESRSRSAGLMLSSNFLGAGIGPLVVAPIIVAVGWRHTFWIVALGGALIGLVLWLKLPRALPRAVTESTPAPSGPRPPLSVALRSGLVLRCAVMFGCFNMLNYGMIVWVPTYLIEVRKLSMVAAGAAAAVPMFATAVAVVIGGWLMSRWFDDRARWLVVPALVVSALLLVAMLNAGGAWSFTVLQTLAMFSAGLAFIGILGMPLRALPRELVGSGMGVVNTGGQLAGVVAPLVMGWLADRFSFTAAFGFLIATTLAAAVISLMTSNAATAPKEVVR